jgi:AcrR family transcriptional regulator
MARPDPKATPRTPLTRERVLRAAVDLADEGGIEALSMRKLGESLGVEAMSLYNHVANKDDLLAGMADLVAGEIELPSSGVDWKSAIRRNAISTRDALVRHAWASGLWMSGSGGGLREAGLSTTLVYHAYHVLEAYVLGYTAQQLSFPYQRDELAGIARGFLESLPAGEYPDFVEHVRQHLEPHPGDESGFELGLDLILDGLESARDTAVSDPGRR